MDNTKNVVGLIFFIIILLIFIVGGYFFMNYILDNYQGKEKNEVVEIKEIKIDTQKDYIYLENTDDIIPEENISISDVIINIKGFEDINNTLHSELEKIKTEKVTLDSVTLEEGQTCSNNSNIYSLKYREYNNNIYRNYISLVINDYDYNCLNGSKITNIKSYIINKEDGVAYTEEELLKIFNVTDESIIEKVNERLHDTQVLDGDIQVIDVDKTIDNIKNGEYGKDKALSISKTGELELNFIVISNRINYNDTITIS